MTKQEIYEGTLKALNEAKIGGKTVSCTPSILTSAGAYTANDCVGGLLKLDSVLSNTSQTVMLKSIVVKDDANQNADLTILLFNSDPSSGATIVDAAAFAWGSGTTFSKCIGRFNVATADYETIDSKSVANIDNISSSMQGVGTNNLWAVIITTGTPTYAANATTLYVTFNFLQD